MTKEDGKEQSPGFEEALERLEKIVEEMEAGKLTLEQMTAHFEEGSRLVKVCDGKLNEVERKIEKLVSRNGKLEEVPFESGETDAD
jgi:exodeoxyribonuclease VII small subunit